MASVWLAHDRTTQSEVALKVLFDHLRDDELVVERFRREVAAARRVRHQNVVSIYELVETSDCLAIVQEFFNATDLKKIIRREGRMRPDRVMRIAAQLLDALEVAHHEGVVHRDLKPHNVLVDAQDHVKLVDFGLARVDDMIGLSTHTMSVGTPEYMAPELVSSTSPDGRADLYALGIVMFEMLTGGLPYTAETPMGLIQQHAEGDPPDVRDVIDDIRPYVADAIMKAMQPLPEDRFATADDMRNALRGLVVAQNRDHEDAKFCHNCGERWVNGFGACLSCGHERVSFEENGEAFVYVVRRYFNIRDDARDLTYDEKHELASRMEALGGSRRFAESKTDRFLDRYPVPIASNLTLRDAELVADEIRSLDIPARVIKPGILGEFYKLGLFADTIWWLKLLAIIAIVLGWAIYLAYLQNWMYGAGVATLLFVGWVYRTWWKSRSLWTFRGSTGKRLVDDDLVRRASEAYQRLRSARSRALVRRILQRAMHVREHFEAEGAPDDEIRQLVDATLRATERIAEVEVVLRDVNVRRVHEQMASLDERIEFERNVHRVDDLIREKNSLHRALQAHDDAQREFARLRNRLLGAYADLDGMVARINDVHDAEYETLSVILREVSVDLSAREEVREHVTA